MKRFKKRVMTAISDVIAIGDNDAFAYLRMPSLKFSVVPNYFFGRPINKSAVLIAKHGAFIWEQH